MVGHPLKYILSHPKTFSHNDATHLLMTLNGCLMHLRTDVFGLNRLYTELGSEVNTLCKYQLVRRLSRASLGAMLSCGRIPATASCRQKVFNDYKPNDRSKKVPGFV